MEPDNAVTPRAVVDIAVTEFARHGFADARLDTIARDAGMSKRMIHYHFGDKRGLYLQALSRAMELLCPPEDALLLDSAVPVEGVRKLVDTLYHQYVEHPDAIRLIALENFISEAQADELVATEESSSMTLYLDRLLLLGQDSGAFRPGISSADVYTLISSLIFHRELNHSLNQRFFSVDLLDEHNTLGLHRMLVDTVLAFLTSNIPSNGEPSYLAKEPADDESADAVYSEGSSLGDELFIDE